MSDKPVELKPEENMSEAELDAELRSHGIDPDELVTSVFNHVCAKFFEAAAERKSQAERIAELERLRDQLKQEAQLWALEARTQRATVRECYAAAGVVGKADWNGVVPVREAFAELEQEINESSEYRQKESERWNSKMDDLEQENASLREQVERLKAPVSDEEWSMCTYKVITDSGSEEINDYSRSNATTYCTRHNIDALLAARALPSPPAQKEHQ
jgi:uncharacterized protein YlxW (UPF0749 family)